MLTSASHTCVNTNMSISLCCDFGTLPQWVPYSDYMPFVTLSMIHNHTGSEELKSNALLRMKHFSKLVRLNAYTCRSFTAIVVLQRHKNIHKKLDILGSSNP